jgi:hypothetical protein
MALKEEMDALAEKIRREIESLGACSLKKQELAPVWGDAAATPNLENLVQLANFSMQYGFMYRVDEECRTASFRERK